MAEKIKLKIYNGKHSKRYYLVGILFVLVGMVLIYATIKGEVINPITNTPSSIIGFSLGIVFIILGLFGFTIPKKEDIRMIECEKFEVIKNE